MKPPHNGHSLGVRIINAYNAEVPQSSTSRMAEDLVTIIYVYNFFNHLLFKLQKKVTYFTPRGIFCSSENTIVVGVLSFNETINNCFG